MTRRIAGLAFAAAAAVAVALPTAPADAAECIRFRTYVYLCPQT